MAIIQTDGLSVSNSLATGQTSDLVNYVAPPAGSQEDVWVEFLDNNLIEQGAIQFANLTANLYYNAVGDWTMLVPYTDVLWNMIQSGDFIVSINWRGLFSFGGKCEQPGYIDSIPGSIAAGGAGSFSGPFISLSGADYLAIIGNRIAYPNPAVAWTAQTAAATDAVSAMPLESAIKHYVSRNVGPSALASRRHSLLDIAPDLARGPNVSYTVKFGSGVDLNLLDVIRALIANGGTPMGIQITRNPATHRLLFDVYIPRNLSGKAWFSEDLGNLPSINFYIADPTCTDSLVQGASSFIAQQYSGVTQWNKTEQFTDDSSETDANNLQTTAATALLTGAQGPTMSATVSDTPYLTFGRDFGVGDIVSLEVRPGAVYSDVISGVALTADPSQTPMLSVIPTVGQSSNATATDTTIIGQLTKRIQALEKKLATK